MLEGRGLVRRFGGLAAVDGIDLKIEEGEIRCIIGPNGAGKTTLFNLLTGHLKPTAGQVLLEERRIDRLPVHRIARLGLARKFQVPSVLVDLSVVDNLWVAADGTRGLLSLLKHKREREEAIWDVLEEIELEADAHRPAGHLSHGQTQRLETGMAIINEPKVLLLDEPTAGMSLDETAATAMLLKRITGRRGLTMVIVEHDIDFIKMIGDRITVVHKGRILMEGSHGEVEADKEVRRVYLGAGL